jgi:hypothetical protein
VQEGLIDVINMRPKSQGVAVATLFPDFQSWFSHHDWMRVPVEATVKRLVSARLDQVYAGGILSRMRGKGKGRAPEDSPLGREKAEKASDELCKSN